MAIELRRVLLSLIIYSKSCTEYEWTASVDAMMPRPPGNTPQICLSHVLIILSKWLTLTSSDVPDGAHCDLVFAIRGFLSECDLGIS